VAAKGQLSIDLSCVSVFDLLARFLVMIGFPNANLCCLVFYSLGILFIAQLIASKH